MGDLYCLFEFVDFPILQEPLKHTHSRIKYTCFDISENFISLGASSGSIYVFNASGKFLHLIPNGNGAVTKIQISSNEKYIAFAQNSKICVYVINLSANATPQVIVSHLSSDQNVQVTSLRWTNDEKQFFFGDNRGQVNLAILSSFIGHNILLSMTIHPILYLDSPIVQVDDYESLLLVSTTDTCILCNTEHEEYKQIGSIDRNGVFGTCFAISTDEAARPSRIYCAKPGSRFWEVDFEGDILHTHQFETALAIPPSKINKKTCLSEDENMEKYEENDEMLDYAPQSLQFAKIQISSQGFLLAYTELGLYIFEMSTKSDAISSRVILWCNQFERILDCKVVGKKIYVFTQTGSLCSVQLSTIQGHACNLVRSSQLLDCACLMRKHVKYFADKTREDYGLSMLSNVKTFLINKQEYELLNDLSVIFDAIMQCEGNADNNSSGGNSINTERYNSLSSTASAHCQTSSIGSKSVYVLENAFCDNLKPQKPRNDRHFKDTLLTVTGKFGKNIIKYKFNIFAEDQQKLVQELIPSKERSMPFKEINILSESEEEIVCRNRKTGSNSKQASSDINLQISAEEKTIYNLYLICKSSQIGNTKFVERYRALFDEYTARELIVLMAKLEKLMLEHGDEGDKAKKNCYEMYFNYLNPELLWEVDEETRDYICEGFIYINCNTDMVRCENCLFPLRFDSSCLFHELGAILLRYYWSRNEQVKCFRVLTYVPALFDVLAKLYLVEGNVNKVIPIVLNYGQTEVLREVGKCFNFAAWMQCFEIFKEYQFGRLMCINCETVATVDNVNRHFFYTWNCFLDIALEHLKAEEILSLIYKWSSCIANDALDREFYIKCLLKS